MKRLILFTLLQLSLVCSVADAAPQSFFTYVSGRVGSFQNGYITVDGTDYTVDERAPVYVHEKRGKALYQTAGSKWDIHAGASVYLKVAGRKVFEITVERWKQ